MKLIGITGLRGHGKTTAANALEMRGYRHINFADPVKEVVELVYGIPLEILNHANAKEEVWPEYPHRTPREIMQQVGTEMFRSYIDDTWIEAFKRRSARFSHVVCSDCRFPNEVDTIHALGGVVIRVHNPRIDRKDAASTHASEALVGSLAVDHDIANDSTIEALHAKILRIIEARANA